ncbi:WD40-repeat-containing domain protein [Apiospora hydei]|uniref:WD40-repeat-containing domain protein n=1 Tax=Apiospora hydei TaxID=1337664 RepID=A0ABR1XD68_9PEZI
MSSTPTNRLRLTPSNSPFLPRPPRSPGRGRPSPPETRLSLKRVVGTTCAHPTGFDTAQSSFAYIAGGAVVVADIGSQDYTQRFFRARPNASPIYNTPALPYSPSTPNANTPKANDSRNRLPIPQRDSSFGAVDWSESASSKSWTSRERVKAATCLALSREGRFLAVGETGYAPRVLIFSLEDSSSDTPLVSISEHMFGVTAVAWSPDSKFLASLGAVNDGFLFLWRIDPKTGAAKLFQQNRCTSSIRGMIWMGNNLITLGIRHVKVWRVEDGAPASPAKQRLPGEASSPSSSQSTKSLPGRNILLGGLLEATFSCAAAIDETRAIICTETGEICLFDDTAKQMKLSKVLEIGFVTTCVTVRDQVAYIGGKSGNFATLDLELFLQYSINCILKTSHSSTGLLAMGFLKDNLVTLDSKRSIDIWNVSYIPGEPDTTITRMQIPGQGDSILGVDVLSQPNEIEAAFYTWSASGDILMVVKATKDAKFLITGNKLGVLKVIELTTKKCVFETKAHTSNCQSIATYEDEANFLIASCARDRTAQLFHKTTSGDFELFQTLEFPAKVVEVLIPSHDKLITCALDRSLHIYDLVSRDEDPDVKAAITSRSLSLKASPSSVAVCAGGKSLFVSLLDRTVCLYDMESGKLSNVFKCGDGAGGDSVVLDSLIHRGATEQEAAFLLGLSNTDKSIRIYDGQTGTFVDREWGHTEAINGVALVEDGDGGRKVISAGSDGTIMIWGLDLQEQAFGSTSRDPSPLKDSFSAARPPLRRVLSKAELAEFQRPASAAGRRSPPRTLTKRRSQYNLASSASVRTPLALQSSPTSAAAEDTPSRRPSADSRSAGSPPASPQARSVARRPSSSALNGAKNKSSSPSLRGFSSLNTATEQAVRTLRIYRKKLAGSDSVATDLLAELDQELRLTSLALGDRAKQSKTMSDAMLDGILEQYSARLISMLDEKLGLSNRPSLLERRDSDSSKRPTSSGTGSTTASDST